VSLLIGAALLFFLATNIQSGWLYVLSASLLGALLAGWIIPFGGLRGLEVERDAPERVHQGEEVVVDVAVSNRGRGSRTGVLVHDPNLDRADMWVGRVRPGERVSVTTLRSARRRGLHESATVELRSGAPFGVAERRSRLASTAARGQASTTLVMPTLVPLGQLPFIEPTAATDHAIHTAPRRGHGPEYLGIREYRAGDSMRHVHWPSTARTGAVMVREFEQEQTRRLAIVVDASWDEDGSWTPLDRVCCAAASIASAALAQGNGARLVTPAFPPGADERVGAAEVLSRGAEEEILECLALLEPGGGPFVSLLDELVGDPGLRGVETVVLVFPTWRANDGDTLPPAIERLAERILRVVALPVVLTREDSNRALDDTGVAGLTQRLRAGGADVYPWMRGEDLASTLAAGRAGR
jgi:uncharacterized protein (DUF58 family)